MSGAAVDEVLVEIDELCVLQSWRTTSEQMPCLPICLTKLDEHSKTDIVSYRFLRSLSKRTSMSFRQGTSCVHAFFLLESPEPGIWVHEDPVDCDQILVHHSP